jgi:CRISPR-associated protein Csd1
MILQALKEYYDRKESLPKQGFEEKEIPFIIVLDKYGNPVNLSSTYEGEGKNRRAKKFLVPQGVKRANNIAANLLWDNPEYALGIVLGGKPERIAEQHETFKKRIDDLGDITDAGISSVKMFLADSHKIDKLEAFKDSWAQLVKEGANLTFRLAEDTHPVFERPAIKAAIEKTNSDCSDCHIVCLISGEEDSMERLHTAIKGVWGAQTSGANIVSFNLDAFSSFGKKQGANAPAGKRAAFAYTTALNHLLSKDSKQRIQVGDASTVFWSERHTGFEEQFANFFSEPPKDDPDRNAREVESLFSSINSGAFFTDDSNNRFYVLGLAPNASRISIRFWIVDTIAGMAKKIAQHFEDLRISSGPNTREFFSLFRLLVSTAVQGKSENIPPNLAGDTMRSILEGLPYPRTLLQAAIRRIRAEHEITHPRAALIKACINRQARYNNPERKEELKVSIDRTEKNIGYRLGRLFSTLEKIQEEANPGLNATIRDRFYGAASGTPATVFGNLMRLKNHHLAKLENMGRQIYFEKLLCEILDGIDAKQGFPAHLNLDDQGRFAIGYYHQRQDFFTAKADKQ